MEFPALAPTSRSFRPGDYPIRQFRSQSGAEIRILYGDSRTGMTLELSYENITDENAELFLDHYEEMKGTYNTFGIEPALAGNRAKTGWRGSSDALGAGATGNAYRYESPPQLEQVRPNVSTVKVSLIGVHQ